MLSMVLESWNVSPTDNRAVHCTLANTLSLSEKYSQTVSVCRMASGTGCTGVHSDVTRFCAAGYSPAVLFRLTAQGGLEHGCQRKPGLTRRTWAPLGRRQDKHLVPMRRDHDGEALSC